MTSTSYSPKKPDTLSSTFPPYDVFHTEHETQSTSSPCYAVTENKEDIYS